MWSLFGIFSLVIFISVNDKGFVTSQNRQRLKTKHHKYEEIAKISKFYSSMSQLAKNLLQPFFIEKTKKP